MLKPTERTCLVTHRGCLDGTGSALMFVWAGGQRDKIIFRNPSGLILAAEDLPTGIDEVWYADCCPSDLTDPCAGYPFKVFDHHISNQRKHGDDPRCTFDMDKSGTSLMAHVLGFNDDFDASRQTLIEALESYDLGRFDNVVGQRLADLAASYSQEELLDIFIPLNPADILHNSNLTSRADALAAVRALYSEAAARSALYTSIDGIKVGISSSPVYWKNEVSEKIMNSGKADMAVIFDVAGGMVSLRSRPDGPDCSLFAGNYGGGGHARAAGFKSSSHSILNAMFQEVFG